MQYLNRKLMTVGLVAAVTLTAAPPAALAQSATPAAVVQVVVGVLDVQLVLRDSKAAKSIRAGLDKQAAAYQAELAQQENSIRAADQQLQQQRATLSAQDYETKRAALGQKVESLRQTAATRNKQLQQMENGAMTQVTQALLQATAEIAKAHGITLVINKSVVVVNATNFDITQEALQKLDARLPSVKLAPPQ